MELGELLTKAIEKKVSDVHLKSNFYAHFRVQGRLERTEYYVSSEDLSRYISKILKSEAEKSKLAKRGEIDASYELGGRRFRVNIFREGDKYSAVLRMLPDSPPLLSSLGLPQGVEELSLIERGMVLVVGITGSGKSTTLAGMLEKRNREKGGVVITIENPVEYKFKPQKCLFYQREVGRDTESFYTGLVSALREDPDVIMVGEIREAEQMSVALSAVETGHAVYATVHANDSLTAIMRILSFYPSSERDRILYSLSYLLRAVISQRLVLGTHGKLVPVVEFLLLDDEEKRELVRNLDFAGLRKVLEKEGGDFKSSAERLLKQGIITKETYLSVCGG